MYHVGSYGLYNIPIISKQQLYAGKIGADLTRLSVAGREYVVYAWRDENSVYVADENEKLIYGNVYFENPDRAIKFFVDLDTKCGIMGERTTLNKIKYS
jgi:hypothetical protein